MNLKDMKEPNFWVVLAFVWLVVNALAWGAACFIAWEIMHPVGTQAQRFVMVATFAWIFYSLLQGEDAK